MDNPLKDNFLIENKCIFKKYEPIKKIGQGAFGDIYSVRRLTDNMVFALKAEKKNSKKELLKSEAYTLIILQGFGIPKYITFGQIKNYNILIEELLDKSLYNIFIQTKMKCNLIDVCLIGVQLLDRLEWIHSKDIIYRDIKPDNILRGIKDPNVLYFVDFGFCKKYRSSKTGKHLLPKITRTFSGTIRYASVNILKGKTPSRRDDIISLGYMLIYLYKRELPWDFNMPRYDMEKMIQILRLKNNNGNGSLFRDLPPEFEDYIKYAKNLKFEQNPNYSYLRSLFLKIIEKNNFDYKKLTFTWIESKNKILYGIPKNKFLRKSTSHSRIFRNIKENSLRKVKRDLSQDVYTKKVNDTFNINNHNKEISTLDEKSNNINNNNNKLNDINSALINSKININNIDEKNINNNFIDNYNIKKPTNNVKIIHITKEIKSNNSSNSNSNYNDENSIKIINVKPKNINPKIIKNNLINLNQNTITQRNSAKIQNKKNFIPIPIKTNPNNISNIIPLEKKPSFNNNINNFKNSDQKNNNYINYNITSFNSLNKPTEKKILNIRQSSPAFNDRMTKRIIKMKILQNHKNNNNPITGENSRLIRLNKNQYRPITRENNKLNSFEKQNKNIYNIGNINNIGNNNKIIIKNINSNYNKKPVNVIFINNNIVSKKTYESPLKDLNKKIEHINKKKLKKISISPSPYFQYNSNKISQMNNINNYKLNLSGNNNYNLNYKSFNII